MGARPPSAVGRSKSAVLADVGTDSMRALPRWARRNASSSIRIATSGSDVRRLCDREPPPVHGAMILVPIVQLARDVAAKFCRRHEPRPPFPYPRHQSAAVAIVCRTAWYVASTSASAGL